MPTWVWVVLLAIIAVAVVASAMINGLAAKHQAGEKIGWFDIALVFAQGVDDAKEVLSPEARKQLGDAMRGAAEKANKHKDAVAFLNRFGFNKPKPPTP